MEPIGLMAKVSGQSRTQHAANTLSVEQTAAAGLMAQYFITTPGRLRAWLVFDATTHGGLLFLVGPLRPHKRRLKRIAHLLGVAEVEPREELRAALSIHGPEGLRYDGVRVALAGH
jgi:hypothetical protein